MSYEPWTDAEKECLRTAVADGMRRPDIVALFPNRTPAGVATKLRYERHRHYILAQRSKHNGEDIPVDNTDAINAGLANEDQDAQFQDAMRAAIQAGLERAPTAAPVDYAEFRPAPFHPAPRVSYGGSPAAQCAELGAA